MINSKKPFVAGNWKMNGLSSDIAEFAAISAGFDQALAERVDAMVCPPYTLLQALATHPRRGHLQVGAQDCHEEASGAHTGDVSAVMLAECGASAVIVGHSERRVDHAENDDLVAKKAKAAWAAGLTAIICIGESADQRTSGVTLDVLEHQVRGSVPADANGSNTIIAYEPVWAIGTGLTPSVADVAAAHNHIRTVLQQHLNDEADAIRILYGGSVKPDNASALMSVEHVDGALVGGASLKASSFLGILSVYR